MFHSDELDTKNWGILAFRWWGWEQEVKVMEQSWWIKWNRSEINFDSPNSSLIHKKIPQVFIKNKDFSPVPEMMIPLAQSLAGMMSMTLRLCHIPLKPIWETSGENSKFRAQNLIILWPKLKSKMSRNFKIKIMFKKLRTSICWWWQPTKKKKKAMRNGLIKQVHPNGFLITMQRNSEYRRNGYMIPQFILQIGNEESTLTHSRRTGTPMWQCWIMPGRKLNNTCLKYSANL